LITSISIENFKGIGQRVKIPLKPITLLFGPNSAGKSTILHATELANKESYAKLGSE
jgi:predicted ATPase